jgi:hypothetical protein
MSLEALAAWFESGTVHNWMVEIFWLFPLMETIHFIGLSFMFGSLLVIDGRVLGLAKFINMKAAMNLIPLAIGAFSLNLISGYTFLAADPNAYLFNIGFQWKMGMIAIAGINALWFWFGEHKQLCSLADGQDAPFTAKLIALASLVIWVIVIVLGRMIPYTDF